MNMDNGEPPKEPDKYSKQGFRRPSRRCTYIIITAVIALCLILAVTLGVLLSAKSKDYCPEGIHCDWRSMPPSEFLKDRRCDSLCTTQPCMKSAQFALSRIDSSKDPCEDFYDFACGTFVKESVLLPERSGGIYTYQEMETAILLAVKDIIDSVTEKPGKKGYSLMLARKVYDDCVSTDNHPDVLTKEIWEKLFSENGMLPWPLINENTINERKALTKLMSSSLFFGSNPFFTMLDIQENSASDTTKWNFRVLQPDLEELKTIYEDPNAGDDSNIYVRYHIVIAKILTDIGLNVTEMGNITREVVEFEKAFLKAVAKANKSTELLYKKNPNLRRETHTHSCQELEHRMRNITWCRVFRQLLSDYGKQEIHSIGITLPAIMDYFEEVDKLLGRFTTREVANYIAVKFIFNHLKYMPSPLRNIHFQDEELFPGDYSRRSTSARWQQCVDIVSDFLWLPLEREHLKENFDEEKRAKILYMVRKMKETYLSAVEKMSWIKGVVDPKEMINAIAVDIGFSDHLTAGDEIALDRYLQNNLDPNSAGFVTSKNSLIEDVLALKALLKKAALSTKKEISLLNGIQSFSLLNHFVAVGKIDLRYGTLQFPMFLPGRPMYAEYATFGSHLFSYMTVLLFVGMARDNGTIELMSKPSDCLEEQYKTEKDVLKVNVNDRVRAMRQLFNAVGIHGSFQAYKTYLKENGEEKGLPGLPFTNEQIFFISHAQIQCEKFTERGYSDFPTGLAVPAKYRVNVPLANLKEFSDAFRCPRGASMNPKLKCCLLGEGSLSHNCD